MLFVVCSLWLVVRCVVRVLRVGWFAFGCRVLSCALLVACCWLLFCCLLVGLRCSVSIAIVAFLLCDHCSLLFAFVVA